jgi:two-component system response regulator VicR
MEKNGEPILAETTEFSCPSLGGSMAGKLLLVDDDRPFLHSLARLLAREKYHVTAVPTLEEARRALETAPFDLMLLDVNLPVGDGISFCRQVRVQHHLPILLLTARDSVADRVVGLEVGADDYITKPFEPAELLARVRAHLRRSQEYQRAAVPAARQIRLGPLVVDPDARDAHRDGRPVGLTQKEFDLLHLLARHRNKALASEWIFEQVWGYDADPGAKTMAVYVRRLRRKIEVDPENPRFLVTVRGFGYQLVTPEGES